MEDVRIQELKNRHSRLFVAPLAHSGYSVNPVFVLKLFFRHSFRDIEKLLGDEAFEFAERFPFEDVGDLLPFPT
ncbi:MAG TPA: hypothetical protein VGK64_14220 [Bryobacteraceae bacterium]